MKSQNDRLAAYLRKGRTITQMEALDKLGIFRLAARIYDLREMGLDIASDTVEVENRWKETCKITRYYLA